MPMDSNDSNLENMNQYILHWIFYSPELKELAFQPLPCSHAGLLGNQCAPHGAEGFKILNMYPISVY